MVWRCGCEVSAPRRRLFGLSWVGWLNYLVLRWFFVRLAYSVDKPIEFAGTHNWVTGDHVRVSSTGTLPPDLQPNTNYRVKVIDRRHIQLVPPTRWFLTRWIWPLPWSACRHIGRPRGGVV